MTNVNSEIDVKERNVDRLFVEIGGKEVLASKALDFLEILEEKSSFDPQQYRQDYQSIGEALEEINIVETDVSGRWHVTDEEQLQEVSAIVRQAYE